MIDIENHIDLAHFYANKSDKRHLQGVELDDLFQCAMVGLWMASKTYDDEQGAFSTYAHQFIEGEINSLVYKQAKVNGINKRVPRIQEELFSDILDIEMDACDNIVYEDTCFDDEYLVGYLKSLSLSSNDKTFFVNMVKYGDTEATQLYMTVNNCTRQHANKIKHTIRDQAKKLQKEIG